MPGISSRRSTSVGPNTSPDSHVASSIYGLNTHRTIRTTTSQESIEQQTNKVKDSLSGKNFLEAKLLCHVDQPFTLNHLILVLFQITQISSSTPVPVIAAIQAIAFILKDHVASELATLVAKQVTDEVTSKLVDHVVAAISPQVALKALQTLAPSLDAMQEKIDMLSTQMTQAPSQLPTSMFSYSVAVTANLDPTIDKAIGRAAIWARQILLDPKPNSTLFPVNTPTSEIAKKLNDALDKARDDSTPQGKIRVVSVLKNDGIIVELESESLASWLNNQPGKTALENYLDINDLFRYRSYPIVLEYLPIKLQIENEDFLHQLEQENQLPPLSLASIRWIKPTAKHSPQQTKAFALVHVSDIHVANDILHNGLCMANEHISVHKDKKELMRCAKCQKYNHIAKNCSSAVDICGMCGENHHTSSWNSYCTTRCINCRSQQHTSWSRSCLEFAK
ncbi:hypothetical protein CY34DRAFT_87162 [Suillus luteus UH-Slu-Lm8-n1]|uniref:CCHC-type domain-containing protein n=1 Tax=Suillus luteus UH-Slu-Lm8-n1 TaxID=930992 RepID=A0A0C9ZRX9_9AGAM|nr:hypothetical protein CY34DRAFT_87162 [Suillus luteus UH-Slu-Lm8-n1]